MKKQRQYNVTVVMSALLITLITGCVSQDYKDARKTAKAVHSEMEALIDIPRRNNVVDITRPPINLNPIKIKEVIHWLDEPVQAKRVNLPLGALLSSVIGGATNEHGEPINIIFGDGAKPSLPVTLNIQGSRGQILKTLAAQTGYAFTPTRNDLTVQKFVTETFVITLPTGEQSGQQGSQGKGGDKNGKKVEGQFINVTYEKVNVVEDVTKAVGALLKVDDGKSDGLSLAGNKQVGSVIATPSLSGVTVRTTPERMSSITSLIERYQAELSKQVLLVVRILEFRSTLDKERGIDWDILKDVGEGTLQFMMPGSSSTAQTVNSGLAFTGRGKWNGTKAFIKALEQQGDVSTDTPLNLLVLNTQPARLSQSLNTPFLSEVGSQVTDAAATTTTERDSVDEGLDVMVSTNAQKDFVWLRIAGKLTKISSDNETQVGNAKLRFLATRNVDINFTNKLRYGQTVVIGSVKQQTTSASKSKSYEIDGLGTQVTNRESVETLILLTPWRVE